MPIRAVVFDLFITLTDWEAERCRPRMMDELAAALGADPSECSSLMRATFTERVSGEMGDARATFSSFATRLGCEVRPAEIDRILAMRYEHTRRILAPRAGVLNAINDLRIDGYSIGVLTDCTAETPELWTSLPYAVLLDAVTFSCDVGHRKPHPAGYHDIIPEPRRRRRGLPLCGRWEQRRVDRRHVGGDDRSTRQDAVRY